MNLARIHSPGSVIDPPARDDTVSSDFGQWYQHESTLEQARVRQRQIRLIPSEVVIGKDVDVGGAGAIAFFMGAVAAEPELYLLRACQQFTWAECCFNHNREIDEMRLIFESPRWGSVVGRTSHQTHFFSVAEQHDGAVENSAAVSDIATERHQRFRHGGFSQALPRRR